MQTAQYHNAPLRNCTTCAHWAKSSNGEVFDKCRRFQTYTAFALHDTWKGESTCGGELREWRPKPPPRPRRSLRQWLYDLLFA